MSKLIILIMVLAIAGCAAAATEPAKKTTAADAIDYRCKTDDDCAVKDVGNCCGYYPACVNRDSPTFPDRVKAECASKGTMGVCGFPTISSCSCVEGRCAAVGGGEHVQ